MEKAIIETLKGNNENDEKYYIYPVTLESAIFDENGISLKEKLKNLENSGAGSSDTSSYTQEEVNGFIDEIWKDQSIGEGGDGCANIEAYSPEEVTGFIDEIWKDQKTKEGTT